jgi:hypothetical protein
LTFFLRVYYHGTDLRIGQGALNRLVGIQLTQDVLNVPAEAAVAFAVSVIADVQGQKVSFEGFDTLKTAQ